MRVCLVNPPQNLRNSYHIKGFCPTIPLGLAYIASVLEEQNHKVSVIDAAAEGRQNRTMKNGVCTIGLPWEAIKRKIKQYRPDVLGVSCLFSSRLSNALEVAKIAKEVDPNIKTVMGGIHPTILPKETLKHPAIDFVVIGEGEDSTVELLRKMEDDSNFSSIDGIGWKRKNQILVTSKTKFISELDKLPFPARHLFPMNEYFKVKRVKRSTGKYSVRNLQRNSIITSRGCPFNCTFCSIHFTWGYKWRARSPKNVVEEIKSMIDGYGIFEISFEDDNLTLNRQHMMKICKLIIQQHIDIKWDTPNGVATQTLDRELLTAMKKSGCSSLNFGIESGDPYILNKVIRKALTLNKVKKVVSLCKEIGISTLGYFVIGMPGETRKSVLRTIDFAKSLALDELNVFIATPYPGTDLYNICLEKGYISEYKFEDYLADDDIETLAMINTPQLKSSELQKLRLQFYEEFNKSKRG